MVAALECTDEKQVARTAERLDGIRKKVASAIEKMPPISDGDDLEAKAASERTLKYRQEMLASISAKVMIKVIEKDPQDLMGLGDEAGHVPVLTRSRAAKVADAVRDAIQSSPRSPFNRQPRNPPAQLTSTPNDDFTITAAIAGKPPAAPPKSGQERTKLWVKARALIIQTRSISASYINLCLSLIYNTIYLESQLIVNRRTYFEIRLNGGCLNDGW